MSYFLTGYIVFGLCVLVIMNLLLRRSGKRKRRRAQVESLQETSQESTAEPTIQEEDLTEQESTAEPTIQEEDLTEQERKKSRKSKISREKSHDVSGDPLNFKKGPMLVALLLGAFAAVLNQTLLNVALPSIMSDFHVTASTVQWLTTGYMLVNGVLIPVTAFLMQSISTRKLFLTAMLCFAAGTFICSIAPSFLVLLLGRIVQAVGAGILIPLLTNIFMTIFPVEKRGTAMGMLGLVLVFAPAIGPTLSGWIVQNYSWRILFLVVLPIAVIDIILALFLMKNVLKLRYPKIDILGIILSTIGFGALLYGFSEAGNNSWGSTKVVLSLMFGGIGIVLFIVRELTIEDPMLEFRVFKYNMFSLTTAIRSIAMMAMFAGMILIPIYMQTIRGYTPLQSGLLLLPGAIFMGIFQPIAGRLFDKIGARPLAIVGLAMTVWTTWEFQNLTVSTSYAYIMFLYGLRMVGMAGIMMPVMTAGLNQLPPRLTPHGTAMANTMRGVASSIGTAFLVSVFTSRTQFHIGKYDNAMTSSHLKQQVSGLSQQLASATGMTANTAHSMTGELLMGVVSKHAMIQGMDDAFYIATGLAALAFVLSFFIRKTKPEADYAEVRPTTSESMETSTAEES